MPHFVHFCRLFKRKRQRAFKWVFDRFERNSLWTFHAKRSFATIGLISKQNQFKKITRQQTGIFIWRFEWSKQVERFEQWAYVSQCFSLVWTTLYWAHFVRIQNRHALYFTGNRSIDAIGRFNKSQAQKELFQDGQVAHNGHEKCEQEIIECFCSFHKNFSKSNYNLKYK